MLIWKAKQDFQRVNMDSFKPLLTPHPLHRPLFLNIQALPVEVKETITRHFQTKTTEIIEAIELSHTAR